MTHCLGMRDTQALGSAGWVWSLALALSLLWRRLCLHCLLDRGILIEDWGINGRVVWLLLIEDRNRIGERRLKPCTYIYPADHVDAVLCYQWNPFYPVIDWTGSLHWIWYQVMLSDAVDVSYLRIYWPWAVGNRIHQRVNLIMLLRPPIPCKTGA